MSWLAVAPGLLAMAVLWVLPGYGVLRLLGVRGLVALGAAAAVTSGYAGVVAVVLDKLSVSWSLTSFGLTVLVAWALAASIGLGLGTLRDSKTTRVAGQKRLAPREQGWLVAAWALGGGVLALAMMVGMGGSNQPGQAWDAVYHVNAVWFIQDSGNASSLGGLAPMYADTIAPYYPSVWHSLVAIAPGFDYVTQASNASSIIIGSIIWIAGLIALARVVWPRRALPVVMVPVIAATFVTFPAIAVSMLGVWPFALSVACVPGTLALTISTLRRDLGWKVHTAYGLGLAWAVAGVVLSHGSGLFSLALLAGPVLVVLLTRVAVRWWKRGHRVGVVISVVVGSLLAILGSTAVLTSAPVSSIVSYERGGQSSYFPGLGSLLIDHPLIYVYDFTSFNAVVTVLVAIGIVLSWRLKKSRWLIVALLLAAALTLLAAGPPENPLRVLAGFWYTQASRINQLLLIPAIMLAAAGAAWVADRLSRWRSWTTAKAALSVVAIIAVATFGFRWSTQTAVMSSTYNTWPIAWGTMLEEDEIAMVDRAAEMLPDAAVVLGEPSAGSPYLLARSGVDVVYPQLTPIAGSPERLLLAAEFNRWRTNPEVCEAVRALGVTHVYGDDLTFAEGAKWEEATPGLRSFNTNQPEFELIDSGGQASIYRFTGCG